MKITFLPDTISIDVETTTKILVAAKRAKVEIQYGCASCRCGTCAIKVLSGTLKGMEPDEQQLLSVMKLPTSGQIRLACQARTLDEDVQIDLGFQHCYSPDKGIF